MISTIRTIEPEEVIVKKTVLKTYEFPAVDFYDPPVVEVAPNGVVFVDGVWFRGAFLSAYEESLGKYDNSVTVKLKMPIGEMLLIARKITFITDSVPSSAKVVGTQEG